MTDKSLSQSTYEMALLMHQSPGHAPPQPEDFAHLDAPSTEATTSTITDRMKDHLVHIQREAEFAVTNRPEPVDPTAHYVQIVGPSWQPAEVKVDKDNGSARWVYPAQRPLIDTGSGGHSSAVDEVLQQMREFDR